MHNTHIFTQKKPSPAVIETPLKMKNGPGDSRIEATAVESFGELWVIAML